MEKKITKLDFNGNTRVFSEALGISKERFSLISDTVYNITKNAFDTNTPKTDTINKCIEELNGVTENELLMIGISFGALEHMKKQRQETSVEDLLKSKTPAEIGVAAIDKDAFVKDMKNGEDDF